MHISTIYTQAYPHKPNSTVNEIFILKQIKYSKDSTDFNERQTNFKSVCFGDMLKFLQVSNEMSNQSVGIYELRTKCANKGYL